VAGLEPGAEEEEEEAAGARFTKPEAKAAPRRALGMMLLASIVP
jgi:hypothetical protein